MKKFICLTAIAMLTLTACASKAEGGPENNSPEPTITVEPTNTPTQAVVPTAEPTKRPADNKTIQEHQELAEKIYQAVKDRCTYNAELMMQDDATYMSDVLGRSVFVLV